MAIPKRARVIQTEKWNGNTCQIRCEMIDPPELGFTGGQYLIVNSGTQLPNGKMGKRAYSIASPDSDQKQFHLVVRRIPGGVGSTFIHNTQPNQVFEFSGPWGKFLPPDEGVSGEILIAATDTGLTAALGLLLGQSFEPFLARTRLIWFVESETYFITPDFLNRWIPAGMGAWRWFQVPCVGDPRRIPLCSEAVEKIIGAGEPRQIYLAGDGLVIGALKKWWIESGRSETDIVTEVFFNHEERKAPSAEAADTAIRR